MRNLGLWPRAGVFLSCKNLGNFMCMKAICIDDLSGEAKVLLRIRCYHQIFFLLVGLFVRLVQTLWLNKICQSGLGLKVVQPCSCTVFCKQSSNCFLGIFMLC